MHSLQTTRPYDYGYKKLITKVLLYYKTKINDYSHSNITNAATKINYENQEI